MGFEYMLFDEALRDRFLAFVTAHGIDSTMRPDEIAGFVVELPDGLADDLQDAVEDFTPEEVHEIASAIAQSIENPVDGPLCRKPSDE